MAYGTPVKLHDLEGTQKLAMQTALPGSWTQSPPEAQLAFLFRVDAVCYAGCRLTEYDAEDYYVTDPRLEVHAYEVHRWTPHGATLVQFNGARRQWVDLRPGAKQWASRSVEEAVFQFAERRKRQIYVLERKLARARQELALTQNACLSVFPV